MEFLARRSQEGRWETLEEKKGGEDSDAFGWRCTELEGLGYSQGAMSKKYWMKCLDSGERSHLRHRILKIKS